MCFVSLHWNLLQKLMNIKYIIMGWKTVLEIKQKQKKTSAPLYCVSIWNLEVLQQRVVI